MKDIFSGQNIQRAFQNPLTMAGFAVMQGAPMGQALMQASEQQRQQQYAQLHQAQFQAEQQKQAHARLFAQNFSDTVKGLGAKNIEEATAKLVAAGADPEMALKLAQGITKQEGADYFTGPGHIRYMTRKNPETGEVESIPIPGQRMTEETAGVGAASGLKLQQVLGAEAELRKEYIAGSKVWNEVNNAYGKIKTAAANPSAANDVALLYGYMKILDPGSVVRESEYATAENTAGVPERVRAQYNKALSGERLTPSIRKDFVRSASDLHKSQAKNHHQLKKTYTDITKRSGLNPENTVINYEEETPYEVNPEQSAPRKFKGENGHVYSQEEIDAALRGE